jgi:glycosyltransferase involved in cell wall biosynthesis/GT2 family glycosyltransferase
VPSQRIIFVATELTPELPGGAGTVVDQLATRLAAAGVPVTVVVVTERPLAPGGREGVEVLVARPAAGAASPFLARSEAAGRAVADLVARGKVDRVEFQDFDGLPFWGLVHRGELGLAKVPLLVRMHGPIDLIQEASHLGHPEWGAVVVMEREAFRMADGVLAASEPMRRLVIERYQVDPERVLVAEPPVPRVTPARRESSERPEFVCLGRLGEVKGSHDFLAAGLTLLEERSDLCLRFVGADGWSVAAGRSMREWLEEQVPERHRNRVRFDPPVPLGRLGEALSAAWAVVVPSRFETFCLAAHEARALGLPLVVADLPAFRPYFSEETGVLVYDGSREGLADALRSLAGSPALVERLAAAPPPRYGDALAPYRAPPPLPRHARTQAGLATAALKRLEQALPIEHPPSPVAGLARLGLRLVPGPMARLAVRVVPGSVKDRFRQVASWPEEAARRQAEARRLGFRRRVEAGDFPELPSPTVTVVIPCFDQGGFLEEALMSVFEQTFGSWEVIVVDDGSTDPETLAVLDELRLPRTRVIRQTNQGLPAARNRGMAEGRGEYLVPLDADDQLAPTFLEELMAALETQPKAAFAHCWAELFGDQDALWVSRPYNRYQLLLSNSIIGCVVLRRQAWQAVGGYAEEMTKGNEDWDLWLRLLQSGWDQVEVRRPLFRYRKQGVSMSVETEARFERMRREMPLRHPQLYARRFIEELKAQWYPWVSVLVGEQAGLDSLAAQDFDDLEVLSLGGASDGLRALCAERGWPLRVLGPERAEAVRGARGKFLIEWGGGASPDTLRRLAESLEEDDKALGAGPEGEEGRPPVLWRRWALLDPASPHEGWVSVPVEAWGGRIQAAAWRGAFPTEGWAIELDLPDPGRPVLRQPPEEEGPLPEWAVLEGNRGGAR